MGGAQPNIHRMFLSREDDDDHEGLRGLGTGEHEKTTSTGWHLDFPATLHIERMLGSTMRFWISLYPLLLVQFRCVHSFQFSQQSIARRSCRLYGSDVADDSLEDVQSNPRRAFLASSLAAPFSLAFSEVSHAASEEPVPVFKTGSGLKYIDLEPGTGPTPEYGQILVIAYSAYVKLPPSKDDPSPKPELFETQSNYLLKHGNGRTIAGLDEGLHTMKIGGKRRLLIPPKLGYVDLGLGPVPEYPWNRSKLNKMLRQMVELVGGTLIFEVKLLSAIDDEADQGYYQDNSLSPEDFETLRQNLSKKFKGVSSLPS